MGDRATEPPPRKKGKRTARERFVFPLSPTSMDRVCGGFVPQSTKRCTNWALDLFFLVLTTVA